MDKLVSKTLWVVLGSVFLYAGFALYADIGKLLSVLDDFAWWTFAGALALACFNYAVRGLRWQRYLHAVDVHISPVESGTVFLAGFALSATPGKVGELLKSLILKETHDAPVSSTGPVVLAERLTDFLGLSVLAVLGGLSFDFHTEMLWAVVAAVLGATLLMGNAKVLGWGLVVLRKLPLVNRLADRVEEVAGTMQVLLAPGLLLQATLLSTLGWAGECLGFYLILQGFDLEVSLLLAVFIHSAGSILGAVSMLPGGVGLTEALMVSGLVLLGLNVEEAPALAATLLNRLATLWFAVALGFVALAWHRKKYAKGKSAL